MIHKRHLLILIAILRSASANYYSPGSYDSMASFKIFSPFKFEFPKLDVASAKREVKIDPLKAGQEMIKNVNFENVFRSLRVRRTPEEIRLFGTLGILASALQIEESLRENLFKLTDELLASFNVSTPKENIKKLFIIEETINRDKSAVAILNGMLKYARNATSLDALQKDMQRILHENEAAMKRLRSKKLTIENDTNESDGRKSASTGKLMTHSGTNMKYKIKERLYDVREMTDNHVENIHSSVTENVKQTIKFVQKVQQSNEKLSKPTSWRHQTVKLDPSFNAVQRLWNQVASAESMELDFDVTLNYQKRQPELASSSRSVKPHKSNLISSEKDRLKRQKPKKGMSLEVDVDISGGQKPKMRGEQDEDDDTNNEVDGNSKSKEQKSGQNEGSDEDEFDSSSGSEPGGLLGLILNLSGGDEGSDVGPLIGALGQVITNLLGPGGLDVPVIVSSFTALLASLLAGDDNFGKYAGNLLGVTIDGFTGGGAENNGQFFGQFLGRFISVLSADENDENAPLQPDVFIQNIYDGIGKGSAKQIEEVEAIEEKKPDQIFGIDIVGITAHLTSGILNTISGGMSAALQVGIRGASRLYGGSSDGSSRGSSNSSSDKCCE